MKSKRDESNKLQNGIKSPQAADYTATPDAESSDYGRNHSHQQSHSTPQGVDSAEELPNGNHPVASKAVADESLADSGQDSPHQNASCQISKHSRQDTAGQQSYNRASQQQAGHPQEQQSASSQVSGHFQLQGLSSRRRSMERQSASLTLPFEQLNFAFHHINYSVPATVSLTYCLEASSNFAAPRFCWQRTYLKLHAVCKTESQAL